MRFAIVLLLMMSGMAAAQDFPATSASLLDQEIQQAVDSGLIPGAVVAVGHNGRVVYTKAYGNRSLIPRKEPMTLDTIFDAASLTKVCATTPSIMKLFEQGKIRLDDPVTNYLPEFQGGKSDITVRLLMTHFSGMPPDLILKPKWSGYETGIQRALTTQPVAPPGARFIYSDINFILLGEIVRRVSHQPLPEFAHEHIYGPLGMTDTMFQPPASLLSRIAPTEVSEDANGQPLHGVVHDPTSRYMGGVAGHAGLFTTATDLSKYAIALLNGGGGVFTQATIKKFTEPATPADQPILRGLGWDIDSPFSSNRGELFPIGSFGHTGYTGTSMWLDPYSNTFLILLTNVVHPHGIKSLSSFRGRAADIVAEAYGATVPNTVSLTGYRETIEGAGVHRVVPRNGETLTGLDRAETEGFSAFKGKRIALITNQTGVDRSGQRNIDLMRAANVNIVRLFSPEHGISGTGTSDIDDSVDAKTHIPITSLYSPKTRRITPQQMSDFDAIVFDIQDVGVRFYTYSCTMLYALEDAAKAHKPFYVLDRPNPITGTHVEGPTMEPAHESFVGCFDMPLRHGMTFGELARMVNAERRWNADLRVVEMLNWQRGDWFDSTSLPWIDPSPNIRSLEEALLYPGLAMLEFDSNYSVGRGTPAPFEQIGADWIDGRALAKRLNALLIPGVRVYPTTFQPESSNFAGKTISGVRFVLTDREAFDSTRLGIEVAVALRDLFPGHLDFDKCAALIGNTELIQGLKNGKSASTLWQLAQSQAQDFAKRREKWLLY